MTTLADRPNTALVVIDAQRDVLAGTYEREAVIANIAGLVAAAREADTPVIWVHQTDEKFVDGTDGWSLVPELQALASEPLVRKRYADSFEETDFESVLADYGIGRMFVAGAQTDECVRSTLHGAIVRGYDTVLVSDAHTTEDSSQWGAPPPELVIAHTNLYWEYHEAPGRTAGTVKAADIEFAPSAGAE